MHNLVDQLTDVSCLAGAHWRNRALTFVPVAMWGPVFPQGIWDLDPEEGEIL